MLARRGEAHSLRSEIDGDQGGDIGSRKVIAGHKGIFGQACVEIGIEILHSKLAAWERRAELEGFAAVMEGVRNAAERLKGRAIAGPHDYDQIPALVERSKLRVKDFYADLNARLTEDPFVAGNHFSAADITALVTVDFATKAMSFPAPADHRALNNWYENVSSRPGAKA